MDRHVPHVSCFVARWNHFSPHLFSLLCSCVLFWWTISYEFLSPLVLNGSIKTTHSAAGWPLTKPLQCCSLRLERRGTALLLIFTYQQEGGKGPTKLFALCAVDITGEHTVEHYVEAVMDSTRYFVIRVKDEKTEREALIGLGFRERDESADFRAALQKYETDVAKERTQRAVKMTHQ
jgi:adaptin ear-binding coat-associated protein 1/2